MSETKMVTVRKVRDAQGYVFNHADGTPMAIGDTMEVPEDVVAGPGVVEHWGFERMGAAAAEPEPKTEEGAKPSLPASSPVRTPVPRAGSRLVPVAEDD